RAHRCSTREHKPAEGRRESATGERHGREPITKVESQAVDPIEVRYPPGTRMNKVLYYLREKHLDKWATGYARHLVEKRRARRPDGPRHLIFAFCDHWEPFWNDVPKEHADRRVKAWTDEYPRLAREFVDADGHHPCHSFFFPGEQYKAEWLDRLADFS